MMREESPDARLSFLTRLVGLFHDPAAKGDHLVHVVDDGIDEPLALRIEQTPLLRADAGAAFHDVIGRKPAVKQKRGQRSKIQRCAETELLDRGGRDPPPRKIFQVSVRLAGIEVGKIKARRAVHDGKAGILLLFQFRRAFRRLVVVSGDLQPGARRQQLYRLHELDVLIFLHEANDVPRGAATEAMIISAHGIDGKRRRLFVVKRTGRPIACAPALEADIGADDVDDVILRLEFLQKFRKFALFHTPSLGTK